MAAANFIFILPFSLMCSTNWKKNFVRLKCWFDYQKSNKIVLKNVKRASKSFDWIGKYRWILRGKLGVLCLHRRCRKNDMLTYHMSDNAPPNHFSLSSFWYRFGLVIMVFEWHANAFVCLEFFSLKFDSVYLQAKTNALCCSFAFRGFFVSPHWHEINLKSTYFPLVMQLLFGWLAHSCCFFLPHSKWFV